ncbi:MAG: alpha/beta hydrolase [Deltaproteobacteria bacterium]|nr:alpha/beta hydrolase [Deltaproteobacteria bacterium]
MAESGVTAFIEKNRAYIIFIPLFIMLPALFFGCGSGGGSGGGSITTTLPEQPTVIVASDLTLDTAPNSFDIYRATNADKTVIFLHGGGGTKHNFAYELGINLSKVGSDYSDVNEQVLIDNKVLAVFPQGKAIAEEPKAYTWENYVMTSGGDDMQFMSDLVAFINAQYKITRFFIVGHSNGGMMVNRIWCEAPEIFDAYIAISGPPSEHFLNSAACSPVVVRPYMGIVGSDDMVLQDVSHWEDQTWTIDPWVVSASPKAFIDPVIIGERSFLQDRVTAKCSGIVDGGDADATVNGSITTWSFCNDSIQLVRVDSAGHSIGSLESVSGSTMLDMIFEFIARVE